MFTAAALLTITKRGKEHSITSRQMDKDIAESCAMEPYSASQRKEILTLAITQISTVIEAKRPPQAHPTRQEMEEFS